MHFELHMTLVETCVVAVWGLYWRNYEFCWVRKPLQHFGSPNAVNTWTFADGSHPLLVK